MKSAVGYGFAQQQDVMRTLERTHTRSARGDDLLSSESIKHATQSLADKLAPYVAQGTARLRELQERRRPRAARTGARSQSPSSTQSGVHSPSAHGWEEAGGKRGKHGGQGGGGAVGSPGSLPGVHDTFSLSMSASGVGGSQQGWHEAPHKMQHKMSHVNGPRMNYEAMHEQLSQVMMLRMRWHGA